MISIMKQTVLILALLICSSIFSQSKLPDKVFVMKNGDERPFTNYKIRGENVSYEYEDEKADISKHGAFRFKDVSYYYNRSQCETYYPTVLPPNKKKVFLSCALIGDQKLYRIITHHHSTQNRYSYFYPHYYLGDRKGLQQSKFGGQPAGVDYYLGDENSSTHIFSYRGKLFANHKNLRDSLLNKIQSNERLYNIVKSDTFKHNYTNVYAILEEYFLEQNQKKTFDQLNAKVVVLGKGKRLGIGTSLELRDETYSFKKDFKTQLKFPAHVTVPYELNGEQCYVTASPHYTKYYELKRKASDTTQYKLKFFRESEVFQKIKKLPVQRKEQTVANK